MGDLLGDLSRSPLFGRVLAETPEGEEATPEVAIIFVGVSLFLGAVCRQVFAKTPVPYTVALLLVGLVLGTIDQKAHDGLGQLGVSIRLWANINPALILFVFLPALLFESAFSLEVHQVRRCLTQMALLAGPGVLINTVLLGLVNKYLLPYNWDWPISLLLGALLSATDPVAVVALLRELGASKKLSTIIEGESLMNDGTAIVMFRLFFNLVQGDSFHFGSTVVYLVRVCGGSLALGIGFGFVCVYWLGFVFNDTLVEITITLVSSYLAYYTAETQVEMSGVLTVMTLGIFLAAFAKTAFTGENEQSLHYFWQMVAYIANTLIFILAGVIIAESILRSANSIAARDWGYLVLLYVFVQVARAIVVGVLFPVLRICGYGLHWKESIMLTWAGLRGAVALSLALTVSNDTPSGGSAGGGEVSELTRARVVFLTGGTVFLTLVVNGSTTKRLLTWLGLSKMPPAKVRILEFTRAEMKERALQAYLDVAGDDKEFGSPDWPAVQHYVSYLEGVQLEREEAPRENPQPEDAVALAVESLPEMHLMDTRLRFLRGVQAAYWEQLEADRLTQTEAGLLMSSVDYALDRRGPLQDWADLKSYVHLFWFVRLTQRLSFWLPRRIVYWLLFYWLERACGLAGGYLAAHEAARGALKDFMGEENSLAEAVVQESLAEETQARTFLEDVRLAFPQVLVAIKTRQVAYHVLRELEHYVEELGSSGLLDDKELVNLHNVVKRDVKRLMRHPPHVQRQSVLDVLRNQPLVSKVSEGLHTAARRIAKDKTLMRGTPLYKEGDTPSYAFVLAAGVVKAESGGSVFPAGRLATFYAGMTLGLYEMLTGQPMLFSAVADSTTHTFRLEKHNIEWTMDTSPESFDFFWKEAALPLARVLLKTHFEGIGLPGLRYAVTEKSILKDFEAGGVLELAALESALLLTGGVKNMRGDQLQAPAALGLKSLPTSAGPLDTVRLRSELQYTVTAPSRLLVLRPHQARRLQTSTLGRPLSATPSPPPSHSPAQVTAEPPPMRRTYSDLAEATLSHKQGEAVQGSLAAARQRPGGQSLLDLRPPRHPPGWEPAPQSRVVISDLWRGHPSSSSGGGQAALLGLGSSSALHAGLHRQELRRNSRPLLLLGVAMPTAPSGRGNPQWGSVASDIHDEGAPWAKRGKEIPQEDDDDDAESIYQANEDTLFHPPTLESLAKEPPATPRMGGKLEESGRQGTDEGIAMQRLNSSGTEKPGNAK